MNVLSGRSRQLAGLLMLVLLVISSAWGAETAIPPVARVTDLTGTLSAVQQQMLSTRLADFEREQGSQLAVLVLSTTKPETIEQYGIRVGEAWKLGRKGVDDGVILIVAKDDHRLRIEVGYGLEGEIPDVIAKRIIDDAIAPAFKTGDYYAGIDAGVDQIISAVRHESSPRDATEAQATSQELEERKDEFDKAQKELDGLTKDQDDTIALILGFFGVLLLSFAAIWIVARRAGSRPGTGQFEGSASRSSSRDDDGGSSDDDDFRGGGGSFGGGGASGNW